MKITATAREVLRWAHSGGLAYAPAIADQTLRFANVAAGEMLGRPVAAESCSAVSNSAALILGTVSLVLLMPYVAGVLTTVAREWREARRPKVVPFGTSELLALGADVAVLERRLDITHGRPRSP